MAALFGEAFLCLLNHRRDSLFPFRVLLQEELQIRYGFLVIFLLEINLGSIVEQVGVVAMTLEPACQIGQSSRTVPLLGEQVRFVAYRDAVDWTLASSLGSL